MDVTCWECSCIPTVSCKHCKHCRCGCSQSLSEDTHNYVCWQSLLMCLYLLTTFDLNYVEYRRSNKRFGFWFSLVLVFSICHLYFLLYFGSLFLSVSLLVLLPVFHLSSWCFVPVSNPCLNIKSCLFLSACWSVLFTLCVAALTHSGIKELLSVLLSLAPKNLQNITTEYAYWSL